MCWDAVNNPQKENNFSQILQMDDAFIHSGCEED